MTNKEKKQLLKDWVKALRSGEYKQTRDYLHDEKGFCCLGVLCDIALDDYWVERESARGSCMLVKHQEAFGLPTQLSKDLGLFEEREDIGTNPEDFLGNMNDKGKSFKEIADWIEKNLINESK